MVNDSKKYKITWSKPARIQLIKTVEYIKLDSPQNAHKVKSEIIKIAKSLSTHPERFPLDKNKFENNGRYRAFTKYNYRVAYAILEDEILILRVRSEKQEPLQY